MATKIKIKWTKGRESGRDTLKIKCNKPDERKIREAIKAYTRIPKNRGKVVTIVK